LYRLCAPLWLLLALGACGKEPVDEKPARRPDVYFVATPEPVVEAMLALAHVGPNDVVYDLGSGDGIILITAAKKLGARGVGIELDPKLVRIATENARKAGVADKVEFRVGDIFETDLAPASVITLYLLQKLNIQLRPKLLRELKPRSRIVSQAFDMADVWLPERTVVVDNRKVFLWTVPETSPDGSNR